MKQGPILKCSQCFLFEEDKCLFNGSKVDPEDVAEFCPLPCLCSDTPLQIEMTIVRGGREISLPVLPMSFVSRMILPVIERGQKDLDKIYKDLWEGFSIFLEDVNQVIVLKRVVRDEPHQNS